MWPKGLIKAGSLGLICILFVSAATAAPPPAPVPGESPTTRDKKIEDRIKYWLEQIRAAKDSKTIDDARKGLTGDYRDAEADGYASGYALLTVEPAIKLLAGQIPEKDPLKRLKEVNVAIVISRMPQKKVIQPALEAMVKHPNPAVRYYGWRGYIAIRDLVLEEPDRTKTMFKSLDKATGETSLAVLALVLKMLYFSRGRPADIPVKTWEQTQETAYTIFDRMWSKLCRQVLDGNMEMADVCSKALPALVRLDAALGKDDKKKRQRLRQMIADLTWCAGQAFDKALEEAKASDKAAEALRAAAKAAAAAAAAGASGVRPAPGVRLPPGARPPTTRPARPTTRPSVVPGVAEKLAEADQAARQARAHRQKAASFAMVLRTCEKYLNALAGMDRPYAYIEKALKSRDDPGGDVRMAVLGKWIKLLKTDGVVEPRARMFKPEPTTKAATATAPAE